MGHRGVTYSCHEAPCNNPEKGVKFILKLMSQVSALSYTKFWINPHKNPGQAGITFVLSNLDNWQSKSYVNF
jgi:hypothetical protein